MSSLILKLESILNELKGRAVTFGPNNLPIREIIKAHNGINNQVLLSYDYSSEFYNGLRCTFGSFTLVFLSNEGNVFYKPGIINVFAEVYINEKEADELQYNTVYLTLTDLIDHLPGIQDGINYNFPGASVTITLDQWQRIKHNEGNDLAGGVPFLEEVRGFLIAAAESSAMIILTDEKGIQQGFLQYDSTHKTFKAIP